MASLQAVSQIPKGSIYGGLALGFSSMKSVGETKNGSITVKGEPSKDKTYFVAPECSYFISDNLAIGAFIGFAGISSEYTYKETSPDATVVELDKEAGPVFGIFARKFWNINENLHTFGGFGLSITSMNGTSTETTTPTGGPSIEFKTESKLSSLQGMFDFGLAYQIGPKFMLVGSFSALTLSSNTYKYNIKDDSHSQTKTTGFDFMFDSGSTPFNLGFIYLLKGTSD